VKVDASGNSAARLFTKEDRAELNTESIIAVKFNMKSIEDWDMILNHINTIGFRGFTIEDFDFFGEGIYSTGVTIPPGECTNPIFRKTPVFKNSEISTMIENINGAIFNIYKRNNDV